MAEYMILLRENDHAWAKLSPDQQQELLAKYYAWVAKLKEEGVFCSGHALKDEGRLLRAVNGEVVDGPFVETKEVLTGYFLIQAASLEAASEIARECPALAHGESVEVRPLGH